MPDATKANQGGQESGGHILGLLAFILMNLLTLPVVYARHPLLTIHCYLNCIELAEPVTEKTSLHINPSKSQNRH